MALASKSELLGLENQELTDLARACGEPAYRGSQLFASLYRQRVTRLDEITTLPAAMRETLGRTHEIGLPRIHRRFVSRDGTIRYLLTLADGEQVEAVWMPEGDGTEERRATICISSQAGCAVNCRFCMTALLGIRRDLTAGEIAGQALILLDDQETGARARLIVGGAPEGRPAGAWPLAARRPSRLNLVFMGMGEPFLNYGNFMKAVRVLAAGARISPARMTVSTAGIAPRIQDFGREPVRPHLAISLGAPNDELRNRLMPLNRKWNLARLMGAARDFPLRPRERLTFEYVLLDGVNDAPSHARELVRLVNGIRCKVNLIALNPGPEIAFQPPSAERVLQFQQALVRSGVACFIRRPRGRDVYAACGQLSKQEIDFTPRLSLQSAQQSTIDS
jgi:23S rRNA (adenine2503-C2)-methyltransferase